MISLALLVAAAAAVWDARRSWRRDRDLNGKERGDAEQRLAALAVIGAAAGRFGIRVPAPPLDRTGVTERAGRAAGTADHARTGSTAAFGAVGLLALIAVGGVTGLIAAAGCAGFGWLYPDLWLRAAATRRGRQIERAAPMAIDLIAAAVDAGIPIDQALGAAADATSGPLRQELEAVGHGLLLGNRREAELRELGRRTASPALAGLASALRISDRLGVPPAEGLRRLAARSRLAQARAIQERAARAAPRILLVVVFVLVPAAMLPVMTGLALTAAGSVGSLFAT